MAAAAACLLIASGPWVFPGEDARHALAWGNDLAGGHSPDFDGPVPAKHPLTLIVGVLLAPLGAAGALTAYGALSVASVLLLGYAAFRFAGAIAGPLAAAAATVVVLTRPEVAEQLATAGKDTAFVALLLLAGALVVQHGGRRPVAVLALLALAGLIRPEAWALAAAFWLWLVLSPGTARGEALRPAAIALLVAAPAIWIGSDLLLTGDPLHTLHHADGKAEAVRDAGLSAPVPEDGEQGGTRVERFEAFERTLEAGVVDELGWLLIAAAALAAGGWALEARRRRGGIPSPVRLAVPLAVIGVSLAAVGAAAAAGLATQGRFLLAAAICLVVVGASSLATVGRRAPASTAAAVAFLAGAVIGLPGALGDSRDSLEGREPAGEQADALLTLLDDPVVREEIAECAGLGVAGRSRAEVGLGRSLASLELDRPVGEIAIIGAGSRPDGVALIGWGPPPAGMEDGSRPDRAPRDVAEVDGWSFASC